MAQNRPVRNYKKKNYAFTVILSLLLMAGGAYAAASVWQGVEDYEIVFPSSDRPASAPLADEGNAEEAEREPPGDSASGGQEEPTSTQSGPEASGDSVSSGQEEASAAQNGSIAPLEAISASGGGNGNASGESDGTRLPREDYPYAVKSSEKVPNSYFDDAIFFGDSISTGITHYNIMPNADVVAAIGINTVNAVSKECVETDIGLVTLLEAAKQYGDKKKVYIMLGGNGLGYDMETFIRGYEQFVDAVKAQYPGSAIYIQTMTPVTDFAYKTYPSVNNQTINEYNLEIQEMAKNAKVYLVDAASALMDENGELPSEASPVDGMHFSPEYYHKWFDYLKSHTAKAES